MLFQQLKRLNNLSKAQSYKTFYSRNLPSVYPWQAFSA